MVQDSKGEYQILVTTNRFDIDRLGEAEIGFDHGDQDVDRAELRVDVVSGAEQIAECGPECFQLHMYIDK